MKEKTISEIAEITGGVVIHGDKTLRFTGISRDTRSLRPGDLFWAIRGEQFDGHRFVANAAASGAGGAVVSESPEEPLPPGFAVVRVTDSIKALQMLAAASRAEFRGTVVGLTGSSGKTSTKEFIASVLAEEGSTASTSGNLNNHIGLPVSILACTGEEKFVVLEMGMNHPGEIEPLARIACPKISVITNIGTAHIEFFEDRAGIAKEKGALFEQTNPDGVSVYPEGDDFAGYLESIAVSRTRPVGFGDGDPHASEIRHEEAGTRFVLHAAGEFHEVQLSTTGNHMVQNALLAAAVGLECGVAPSRIAAGLSRAKLVAGRLEKKTVRGMTILDDTYNANPDSMVAALAVLKTWSCPPTGRRIAVLGKMGELGTHAMDGYRRVGVAAAAGAEILVTVGKETEPLAEAALASGLKSHFFADDTDGAGLLLRSIARQGDVILLKGSRSAKMESLLNHLT